jgi:hypothetical protein
MRISVLFWYILNRHELKINKEDKKNTIKINDLTYVARFGQGLEDCGMHGVSLLKIAIGSFAQQVLIAHFTAQIAIRRQLGKLIDEHGLDVIQRAQFVRSLGFLFAHQIDRFVQYFQAFLYCVLFAHVQFVRVDKQTNAFVPEQLVNRRFLQIQNINKNHVK